MASKALPKRMNGMFEGRSLGSALTVVGASVLIVAGGCTAPTPETEVSSTGGDDGDVIESDDMGSTGASSSGESSSVTDPATSGESQTTTGAMTGSGDDDGDEGEGSDEGSSEGATDDDGDRCETPTEDMCALHDCFDLCGIPVAMLAPPTFAGVEELLGAPARSLAHARAGELLVRSEGHRLVTMREGEIEGSALATDSIVAAVDGVAVGYYAKTGNTPLVIHDLRDSAQPRAVATWSIPKDVPDWRLTGRVVGTSRGELVLRTERGIARVDVRDPERPKTTACFDLLSQDDASSGSSFWVEGVTDDAAFVRVEHDPDLRTREPVARYEFVAFDLRADDPAADPFRLEFSTRRGIAADGARVLISHRAGEIELWSFENPGAPELLDRLEYDEDAVGGFSDTAPVHAGLATINWHRSEGWATVVDMRADTIGFHRGPALEIAAKTPACLVEHQALDGAREAIWTSPWYAPDDRFGPDELPTHDCAAPTPVGKVVAREESSNRLLVASEDGSWIYDPVQPEATTVVRPGMGPRWHARGIAQVERVVQDGEEQFEFALYDPQQPNLPVQSVSFPARPRSWHISDSRAWLFVAPGGNTDDSEVWSLELEDLNAGAVQLETPAGWTTRTLRATSQRVYVASDTEVLVYDDHGELLRRVESPGEIDEGGLAASSFGLFVSVDRGRLVWLPADASEFLSDSAGCSFQIPIAVGDDSVFVARERTDNGDWTAHYDVLELVPKVEGQEFSMSVRRAMPAASPGARVFPGDTDWWALPMAVAPQ